MTALTASDMLARCRDTKPSPNDCKLEKSKSYAIRSTLIKKLEELGYENQYGYVIVQNENGRYTAIFSFTVWGVRPAHLGFYTMN